MKVGIFELNDQYYSAFFQEKEKPMFDDDGVLNLLNGIVLTHPSTKVTLIDITSGIEMTYYGEQVSFQKQGDLWVCPEELDFEFVGFEQEVYSTC